MPNALPYIIIPKRLLNGIYSEREYRYYPSNGVFKNHRTNTVVKPANFRGRPRVLGQCVFRLVRRIDSFPEISEHERGNDVLSEPVRGLSTSSESCGGTEEYSSSSGADSTLGGGGSSGTGVVAAVHRCDAEQQDSSTTTSSTTPPPNVAGESGSEHSGDADETFSSSSGESSSNTSELSSGHVYPLDGNWWNWEPTNIGYTEDTSFFLEKLGGCTRKRRGDNHKLSGRIFSRHNGRVRRRVVEMRLAGHPVREIISELGISKRTVYHIFHDYNDEVRKENESSE
jgi:hypothetical protein